MWPIINVIELDFIIPFRLFVDKRSNLNQQIPSKTSFLESIVHRVYQHDKFLDEYYKLYKDSFLDYGEDTYHHHDQDKWSIQIN